MKTILTLLITVSVLLTACFESESHTQINADGSGQLTSVVDLTKMMQMVKAAQKTNDDTEMNIDTTVLMKTFSDTAKSLTARQKELVREIKLKIFIESKTLTFRLTIVSPFKTLKDFNELNAFMMQEEFDNIFDKAFKFGSFGADEEEKESSRPNDNLFGSVFPNFWSCQYREGAITCTIDKPKFDEALAQLKKMDMDIDGEMESMLLKGCTFTNKISLPRKAKSIKSSTMQGGAGANELVQSGNLLDLYKDPHQYEYTVTY